MAALPKAERHSSGHDALIECEVSDKYAEFIGQHLENMKKQCVHITACIDRLLQDENLFSILRGQKIGLNKICGLVYRNDTDQTNNTLDDLCTSKERAYIKEDIESHLKDQPKSYLKKMDRCLEGQYGDTERTEIVDDICRLASKNKIICRGYMDVHDKTESFFNDQIHHLQCTCQNLNKVEDDDHSHASLYIAAAAGAGLVLLVLLIVGFICYRRRRAKKRKKRGPNVIYLPNPNAPDNNPVYQEVYDDRFSLNPPALPSRYTPHPSGGQGLYEEPAYLEPLDPGSRYRPQLPPMRGAPVTNPGYGAPPKYSEKAEEYPLTSDTDTDAGYFQPLPPAPGEEGDSTRRKPGEVSGYETIESMQPAPPTPQGSNRSNKSSAPVPAKRTKTVDSTKREDNSDDPTSPSESKDGSMKLSESPYFVLEREESTV